MGRAVLLGDHTCVAKDGRKMPCVVSMHQHSETQSKPSYFRGHFWGAIGMLIARWSLHFVFRWTLGFIRDLSMSVKIAKRKTTEKLWVPELFKWRSI